MFRPGENPKNNCVVYSDFYYITPYGQYKTLDIFQCPEEAKFMIKEKNSCIDDCKKDPEYKYLYNGICLKNCPSGMTAINDYICIENKDECKLVENNIQLKKNEDFQILRILAKTYLNEFNYTNKHISLHTNNEYDIIIYKDRNCINKLSLSIPKIDFKECYTKVKNEYNITEDLLISVVDQKGKKGVSAFFKFYHPLSGEELIYTKICQNESILVKQDVSSILNNTNNSNLGLQLSLLEQGVDIFDLDGPFYNDLCYDFINEEERDIPLNMRAEKVFPNVPLCEDNCKPKGIQLPEKLAICDCSINNELIKDNTLMSGAIGQALDLINASNIMVITCYKYIFKYFTRSIGGYIIISLIFGHIICVLIYFLFKLPKLKLYILSKLDNFLSLLNYNKNINKNFPPRRRSLKNDLITNKNNKANKKVNFAPASIKIEQKEGKDKKKKKIKSSPFETCQEQDKNKTKKKVSLVTNTKIKFVTANDITISKKFTKEAKNIKDIKEILDGKTSKLKLLDLNFNKNKKVLTNLEQTDQEKNKKFFEEYFLISPDDMEFDDAIINDKRKFMETLVDNLKDKQMIAFTFFSEDPIKIKIMRIILFILNISLYFVITGLFYNEEYITILYKLDEKKENFFSYIPRSIDKLIYTTIVSIIVGYIIGCFFAEENKMKKILRRLKDDTVVLREEIFKFLKSVEKMYLAFIIFVFIILLISLYYLLCFNYVYPKTQIEWIKCSITIMIVMQILSCLKCLLQTCLRYLSFKITSPKIYKISKFLD